MAWLTGMGAWEGKGVLARLGGTTHEHGMGLPPKERAGNQGQLRQSILGIFKLFQKAFPSCACYFWLAGLSLLPLHFLHNAAFLPLCS